MEIPELPDRTHSDAVTVESLADGVGIAADNEVFREARRARQWLEAASDVTTELLGSGDPGRALTLSADRALLLSRADTAMIVLPSDPEISPSAVTDLRVAVCVGKGADQLLDLMIPVSESTPGAVFADQVPRNVASLVVRPGSSRSSGPGWLRRWGQLNRPSVCCW
jgi:hypothetical protein